MNLLRIQFAELYVRHLCRHAQWGINLGHLGSVIVSYLALFGMAAWLVPPPWLLVIPAAYLVLLAVNVPGRVTAACAVFMVLFFAGFLTLPPLPYWLPCVLLIGAHKSQQWSHKIWNVERDMTEFNRKYQKGFTLFVLLSIYELPILLNYLVFAGDIQGGARVPPRAAAPPAEPPASEQALASSAPTT